MAKLSRDQLLEMVRKFVKEALDEAGPVGYLSKTKRPDAKTGWDPAAQKQWAAGQPTPGTAPGGATTGPTGTATANPVAGKAPPSNLAPDEDKTNAGIPSAKVGMKPAAPAPAPAQAASGQSQADMSAMLQGASQDQIAQIMRILQGS